VGPKQGPADIGKAEEMARFLDPLGINQPTRRSLRWTLRKRTLWGFGGTS